MAEIDQRRINEIANLTPVLMARAYGCPGKGMEDLLFLLDQIIELQSRLTKAERVVVEVWTELYGNGYEVLGFHLNDDLEPLDNFFEENDWQIEALTQHKDRTLRGEQDDAKE